MRVVDYRRGDGMRGDFDDCGVDIPPEDLVAYLERAAELESDQTCPHARPTKVRFSLRAPRTAPPWKSGPTRWCRPNRGL